MSATWDEQLALTSTPTLTDEIAVIDESTRDISRVQITDIIDLVPSQNVGYWDEIIVKSTTQTINSQSAFVDDTELQRSLPIGTFQFESRLLITSDAVADAKVTFETTGTDFFARWGLESAGEKLNDFGDTEGIDFTGGNTRVYIVYKGMFRLTVAGIFKLQFAQLLSDAVSTSMGEGSTLTIKQVV